MACSYATLHLLWSQGIDQELLGCHLPSNLETDDQAAISLIKDHRITIQSKQIRIYYHYVRESLFNTSAFLLNTWSRNPDFRVMFKDLDNFDMIIELAPVTLAPSLDDVLSSDIAPPLNFLDILSLPEEGKLWWVYALIMTKP